MSLSETIPPPAGPPTAEPGAPDLALEDLVTIARAELDALRERAASSERAATVGRLAEAEAARALDAAHAEQLAERDRKAADWELAYRSALRDREVAAALAGQPLVPGAAAQLIALWRDEFDAREERGEFKVSARDGRGVAQAVADRLSSPEYAHFCLPSSRGGVGPRDPGRRGVDLTAPAVGPPPRTLGESVVARWREAGPTRSADATPIGLGRRR